MSSDDVALYTFQLCVLNVGYLNFVVRKLLLEKEWEVLGALQCNCGLNEMRAKDILTLHWEEEEETMRSIWNWSIQFMHESWRSIIFVIIRRLLTESSSIAQWLRSHVIFHISAAFFTFHNCNSAGPNDEIFNDENNNNHFSVVY